MAQAKPKYSSRHKKAVDKQWFVVYCKPNSEKKTAARLNALGIKCYCPTQTQVRQWSDRKKKVQMPVLPSMVLVYLSEKQRPQVFQVASVVRYLYWLKQPATVTEQEIENLQSALSGNYKDISIEKVDAHSAAIKLKGLGIDEQNGRLQYTSKTHYWIYLERLGYVIKVKR